MADIQPCAFCGSPARVGTFTSASPGAQGASWEIACVNCQLIVQAPSDEAAIAQWNAASAKVQAQRAQAGIKDCCKNPANLETVHEGSLMVSRCRVCGCRHFRARAQMAGA